MWKNMFNFHLGSTQIWGLFCTHIMGVYICFRGHWVSLSYHGTLGADGRQNFETNASLNFASRNTEGLSTQHVASVRGTALNKPRIVCNSRGTGNYPELFVLSCRLNCTWEMLMATSYMKGKKHCRVCVLIQLLFCICNSDKNLNWLKRRTL